MTTSGPTPPGPTPPGSAPPGPAGTVVAARPGLRDGWRTFRTRPDRLLVPTVVLSVVAVAVHVVLQHLISTYVVATATCPRNYLGTLLQADCGPSNGRAQLGVLVGLWVIFVIAQLFGAGIDRSALDLVDGRPARGPFRGWVTGRVLVAALALGALLTINTIVLLVPGLVFAFLSRYALLFVVDQGHGTLEAVVESTRLVTSDLASELGFAVRSFAVLLLGLLLLGIGLYVAVPVVMLAQAQRFRARVPAR
ncbi:MAG: hypothetical protein ACJ72D_22815 [Marmoricola sp.]